MQAFKVDFKYRNNIELLDTAIYLYSKTVLTTELTKREKDILREYLLSGYSPMTKKAIEKNLKIDDKTLNVANCGLRKKGFLIPHPTNYRLKLLPKELTDLRDCFMNEQKPFEKSCFIVNFVKKSNV